MINEEFIKSQVVDNQTEDNQCRYCYNYVPNGERMYKVDDGWVGFDCLNKRYGPYCECGNKLQAKVADCTLCAETQTGVFSELDRKKLVEAGFKVEKHPNVPEFAIKKGGFTISINDDGSLTAGYDDGQTCNLNDRVKQCKLVDEAIVFLDTFK